MVSNRRGHPAQQRRNFGPCLRKPENVVDEQQNVLVFFVPEILSYREPRETHAQARARRFGHLAENERALGLLIVVGIDHARFLHLEPQIVPFAGALSHAGEH